MGKYRITPSGVCNTENGALIPNDSKNKDWREYLAWIADGNKPDPYVPAVPFVDENEVKIQAELRKMAIANLGSELPVGYK